MATTSAELSALSFFEGCTDEQLTGLQRADDIAAVVMLQNVRSLEGREVADLAIAAKIVTGSQNSRMTVNMRGTVVVDVATSLTLKADLTGNSQFSGGSAGIKDDKLKVNITGNGKLTFHMIGRIL